MKRLASTLYASYAAIIVICVVSVALYAGVSLKALFLSRLASETEVEAKLASQRFLAVPPEARAKESAGICREIGQVSDTRLTIMDRNGAVLGDSESDAESMDNHGSRPEVVDAIEKGLGQNIRFSKTLRKQMFYLAVPIAERGTVVGVVRAAVPEDRVSKQLNRIYVALAVGALIAAGVAVAVAALLARAVIAPLEALGAAAENLGKGQLDARAPVRADDELGALAQTFNTMADSLQGGIRDLAAERNDREVILASMKEGVVAVDNVGRLIFVNEALREMLGLSQLDVTDKMLIEVIRSAPLASFVRDAQASPAPIEAEMTVHEPEKLVLSLHARPLLGGGILIVARDVTRLRRLEEVRNVFVANVSHELKTPITLIKGCVETLLDGALQDPDKAPQFLATVEQHADRMNAIVDDLLQLSALDAGEEEGERALTDLAAVAERVASGYLYSASQKGISIAVNSTGTPVNATANELLLERAISNLIDNAVKYTDKGGHIVVEVRQDGDRAVLSVKDDGQGIEKRHLEHIFERFYRADKARSRRIGGTGLGLSIVKHIVALQGGSVSVESQPGRGSTFTITLPAS
ncbi:MAG: HAMP domain-containing protein [Candidatus Coatesbacteria bacterium]|nr:HAMP domain-containing protein [Candidatus Coatesbacteria bacterium]